MPRDVEKAIEDSKKLVQKVNTGKKYFDELMTVGVKVNDPFTGEEVTFNTSDEAVKFLYNTRKKDPNYPMNEIGRNVNSSYHMYFFLYSKGITPDEIRNVLENPGKNTELETKIKGYRDEFFSLALTKDTEKVADMYADAFKLLANHSIAWLKDADTLDKFNEVLFHIEVLAGSQSVWTQSNNLSGGMRQVDVDMLSKVQEKTAESGVNFAAVVDCLQVINNIHQRYMSFLGKSNPALPINSVSLSVALKHTKLIDDDATLSTVRTDNGIVLELGILNNVFYPESEMPGGSGADEFYKGFYNSLFEPGEDTVLPHMLYELNTKETINDKHAVAIAEWGNEEKKATNNPKLWRDEMSRQYDNTTLLMDPYSVLHAVNLAKNNEYDVVAGKEGEGQNMLDVMHGQYEKFDQLTSLSKAAVVSRLIIDHPILLMGSVDNMMKQAEKLHLDLDNPVYSQLVQRRKNHCVNHTNEKIQKVVEKMAEKKLSKSIETAGLDEKKNMAKTLLIMQLGRCADTDILKNPADFSMLNLLANGNVKITLPNMDDEKLAELKAVFPVDVTHLTGSVSQETKFNKNSVSFNLSGARGNVEKIKTSEADLRSIDGTTLYEILNAFDYKLEELDENGIKDVINRLNTPGIPSQELGDFVKNLGKDIHGEPNAFEQRMVLADAYIDPALLMTQEEFDFIDNIYSYEPEGERKYAKYGGDARITDETVNKIISDTLYQKNKDVVSHIYDYYRNLKEQISVYGEAAEKMHRIKEENEKTDEPLPNVRTFAQKREAEFAEKYRSAMVKINDLATILKHTIEKDTNKSDPNTWAIRDLPDPDFHNEVYQNYNKHVASRDELDSGLLESFYGIRYEGNTDKTMNKLESHKWTFLGIKFSNSDIYDDIVKSMKALKEMRDKDLSNESVQEYKGEYNHLRDLCAEYIASHRRTPRSSDGKERLKMIKSVWEGMSNADENLLVQALNRDMPGSKISDVNIHKNNRVRASYDDLLAEEPGRKERINAYKEQKARKAAEKKNAEAKIGK